MDKAVKVFLWLVFTVILGTMPLLLRVFNSRTDQTPITWTDSLKSGDLLIVGAVVAADAIGRILAVPSRPKKEPASDDQKPKAGAIHLKRGIKIVCAASCLVLLVLASSQYSKISGQIDAKVVYNTENVVSDSVTVFVCVVAAALGVILVVEEEG